MMLEKELLLEELQHQTMDNFDKAAIIEGLKEETEKRYKIIIALTACHIVTCIFLILTIFGV